MRRFLAIVLLALLPLQFSWAMVATYCGHEQPAGAPHFGHHEHQHRADARNDADAIADRMATEDGAGDKTPGASDLDCGHCHGACSAILSLPSRLPAPSSAAHRSAAPDEACGAHAPTRPERPQWLALA